MNALHVKMIAISCRMTDVLMELEVMRDFLPRRGKPSRQGLGLLQDGDSRLQLAGPVSDILRLALTFNDVLILHA